jgi:hypothetical protein
LDYLDDPERAENQLRESLAKIGERAEFSADAAMGLQSDFAQRLMVASGAALGVLSTLIATGAGWLVAKDFAMPITLFIASLSLSGIGLWSRTIGFFKQSGYLTDQYLTALLKKEKLEKFARLGRLNESALSEKPAPKSTYQFWFNVLDYTIIGSGICFVLGLSWAGLIILNQAPTAP